MKNEKSIGTAFLKNDSKAVNMTATFLLRLKITKEEMGNFLRSLEKDEKLIEKITKIIKEVSK
jgi:hypothetical protein